MSSIDYIALDTATKQLITTDQAWHYRIVPKKYKGSTLELYIDKDCYSEDIENELEVLTGMEIVLEKIDGNIIEKSLNTYYLKKENRKDLLFSKKIEVNSDDFVIHLIGEAKDLRCSDIHIEVYDEQCRIRFRLDGQLIERHLIKKEEYPSLINKIKILSHLDIAEKRLPQDGRIFYKVSGGQFDIRVSVLPTLHGEKIVLRILGSDASDIDIKGLGFSAQDLANYLEGVRKPNGIILISGPTGSGKTTTLYATLKLLNETTKNIITIEDPIEYTLKGINQVQLKENIGLNFSAALRTFLRQDPDIIMVGEIRDVETANMAIRAALTGHLVLSTIHTNSAWGTISRLVDMKIPSYLLANTLNVSVAQRLIRLLCPHCKRQEPFSMLKLPKNYNTRTEVAEQQIAVGCDKCYHTGYRGRKAIYEVIPVDGVISQKIKNNEYDILSVLKEKKIKTLAENAFDLFRIGDTSFEEIYPLLMQ